MHCKNSHSLAQQDDFMEQQALNQCPQYFLLLGGEHSNRAEHAAFDSISDACIVLYIKDEDN